jgi:hypothetical protein
MQFGTTPGIYAGLLQNPETSFGAEAVMNGGILGGYDLYEFDLFTRELILAGTFTFDTTENNLLVSYTSVSVPPVPPTVAVPGALQGAFLLLLLQP